MNAFFSGVIAVIKATHSLVRPYLTLFIATLYNVALVWALVVGKLDVKDYIGTVGTTNSMIVGFWFAEKAALRDPNTPSKRLEGEPDA